MEQGIPIFTFLDGGFLILSIILIGVTLGIFFKKSLVNRFYVLSISVICGVLALFLAYATGNIIDAYGTTINIETNYNALVVFVLCILNPILYSIVSGREVKSCGEK
ncbi:MAG: hypothetical protein RR840_00990 [Clostridium sp.]